MHLSKINEYIMSSNPRVYKQDTVKERLRLNSYEEYVNNMDAHSKGNIKFARGAANIPELLALGMTSYCVRNTCLEDFHSQGTPINDEKMKTFMKECSEKCAEVLTNLLSTDYMTRATMSYFLMEQYFTYCQEWDIPDIVDPSYLKNKSSE